MISRLVFLVFSVPSLILSTSVLAGVYERCPRRANGLPPDPGLTIKQEEVFCRCLDDAAKKGKIGYKKVEAMLKTQNEDLTAGKDPNKAEIDTRLTSQGISARDLETFRAFATYCAVKSLTDK